MNSLFDCAIIGAGAAGLACARRLHDAGLKVSVIEARSRIGGRAHTIHAPHLATPLELGAEFIHGKPNSIIERMQDSNLAFYDIYDEHLFLKNGRLKKIDDFWGQMEKATKKLNGKRKIDRTVQEFLESQNFNKETRSLFRAFVEGFHAADLNILSERGLSASEQVDEDLSASATFRPVKGYKSFLDTFSASLPMQSIRLNSVVKRIDWGAKTIKIETENKLGKFHTPILVKKVVVTLPIGVLKGGDIKLDPLPKRYSEALDTIHMGHIVRMSFVFKTRFWESIIEEKVGFLHAGPEFEFPTWWTLMPMRAPVLVAWQGGPTAEALSQLPPKQRAMRALDTLAHLLSLSRDRILDGLVDFYTHNWSTDPYSLGAYSYLGVEGDKKSKILSHPFDSKLFFAGEATSDGSSRGTIHGAIESGERAARQVLDS